MRFMASMPQEAMQTPAVPPKMMSIAEGWMKEAGDVPSMKAPPRRPTAAIAIPIAEAAFIGVQRGDRRASADLHRPSAPLDVLVW